MKIKNILLVSILCINNIYSASRRVTQQRPVDAYVVMNALEAAKRQAEFDQAEAMRIAEVRALEEGFTRQANWESRRRKDQQEIDTIRAERAHIAEKLAQEQREKFLQNIKNEGYFIHWINGIRYGYHPKKGWVIIDTDALTTKKSEPKSKIEKERIEEFHYKEHDRRRDTTAAAATEAPPQRAFPFDRLNAFREQPTDYTPLPTFAETPRDAAEVTLNLTELLPLMPPASSTSSERFSEDELLTTPRVAELVIEDADEPSQSPAFFTPVVRSSLSSSSQGSNLEEYEDIPWESWEKTLKKYITLSNIPNMHHDLRILQKSIIKAPPIDLGNLLFADINTLQNDIREILRENPINPKARLTEACREKLNKQNEALQAHKKILSEIITNRMGRFKKESTYALLQHKKTIESLDINPVIDCELYAINKILEERKDQNLLFYALNLGASKLSGSTEKASPSRWGWFGKKSA